MDSYTTTATAATDTDAATAAETDPAVLCKRRDRKHDRLSGEIHELGVECFEKQLGSGDTEYVGLSEWSLAGDKA